MPFDDIAVTIGIKAALAPLLMLAGLTYFVAIDKYILKLHKRIMLGALVLITTLVISDLLDNYLTNFYPAPTLRMLNSAYGYIAY